MTVEATMSNLSRERTELRGQIMELVRAFHDKYHQRPEFNRDLSPVPVSGRVYGASDMESLVDSALDFWLTTGRFNTAFERKLSRYLGVKNVLTVNSGSSANLVAFSALTSPLLKDRALQPGDEVITAATGFPTTVNPTLLYGLVPVFVDVLIPTYNIDPDAVEAAISPRTRAIMVAHTLGNPFEAERLSAIAKKHDLFLIEDCCDALGSTLNGKMVGQFGDIGTLSFYPAHHITMGEGGAVFTKNSVLRRAMESIRDWGRDCYCEPGQDNTCKKRFEWQLGELPHGYDHKYIYSSIGYNLKITDMQAAVGLSQLDHLPDFIESRKRNFRHLSEGLSLVEDRFVLPQATPNSDPSWFGYPITVRDNAGFTRDEIVKYLNERRIGTRLLFGGNLIRQPYMKDQNYRVSGQLHSADRIVDHTFWVGVYPGLRQPEIAYVIDCIIDFCRSRSSAR
ncbi:lipopolysaccharide biosynthesis protein RfbH [Methylobacterium durans]|uniref:lipopolysaccharide biosynthesis protein RfbH n=1 Tax=Methylobacterium durans TaxID=2202825 RepID=UPI002AFF0B41|nr:lipopolysaccharide biosynthesis protein RfbH [Methylobacterium durans]MEA1835255.1 lipopolysaccharide biosynthesis protein RfbH [Methylobacterium durans]